MAFPQYKEKINTILESDIDNLNEEDIKALRDFEYYLKIVKKVGEKARIVKSLDEYLDILEKLGFKIKEDTARNMATREDFNSYKDDEILIVGTDTFQHSPRVAFKCNLDDKVRYIHPSMIEILY